MTTTTTFALRGKTALVTGGSRGIGRAIAERLGRDGSLVAVHYGSDEKAAKDAVDAITGAGGRAFAVGARLGEPGDVDRLFEGLADGLREYGETGLDIVVNNAGIGLPKTIEEVEPAEFDHVFAVNTRAPFFIVQRALPLLRDGGRIVNISSGVTRIAFPQAIAYSATKGALDVFTLALAKHLGPRGITVNGVAPGIVDTDINADWLRGNAEADAYWSGRTALGRVGQPDDIADTVAFLASEAGRWVTGHLLDATGGAEL